MAQKTLAEEIITIIKAHSNDNPAPTQATIIRTYEDGNYADVETEDGTYRYVPVIGTNALDTDGVIVYLDGDLNTPLMITAGSGGGTVDIVTEWETTPSDTKVPSEKLTKDTLDTKISKSTTNGLVKNDGTIDTTAYSTFSGDYDDLTDKPTIPSKISDLTNDSDFIEKSSTSGLVKNDGTIDTTQYSTFSGSYTDLTDKPNLATVATTGDYDDLTDTPNIPTDVSDLTDNTNKIPTDLTNLTDLTNILDTIIYDKATTNTRSRNWNTGEAITNTNTTPRGTTLTIISATTQSGYITNTRPLTGDFEAIVYTESEDTGGATRTRFGITDNTTRRYISKGGNTYLRLIRKNNTTKTYYSTDGETWTETTPSGTEPTGSPVYLYIGLYNNTTTVRTCFYRDLKVYPI